MPSLAAESVGVRAPTFLETSLSLVFRLLPLKHGAHRLLDHLRPRAWVGGPSFVDIPYRGAQVRMDVSDLVGWHFFVLRNFDPEVTEIIKRFAGANADDVFWDVGANKGALSFEMATALPSCRIVAIEPQLAMINLLQKNLGALAGGRFEVFPVGIGEAPATLELVMPAGNRGRASLVARERDDGSLVELVQIITAEQLCERSQYGWPTIAKIDVEGFEPAVIRSMLPAFESQHMRCCVFECHASESAGFEQIRSATEPFGYTVHAIRKTPFSTFLVPAPTLVRNATDYALIRNDLYGAK
jgi:FkbM family methyltransferase